MDEELNDTDGKGRFFGHEESGAMKFGKRENLEEDSEITIFSITDTIPPGRKFKSGTVKRPGGIKFGKWDNPEENRFFPSQIPFLRDEYSNSGQ